MGGPHKILFFCKIDAGRINLADKITMKLVHEAASEINNQFGVVVNKVSKALQRKIVTQPDAEKTFREFLFEGIPETSHVVFIPNIDDLEDEDDVLLSTDKFPGLLEFLDQLPIINLTPNRVQNIRVEEFDAMMLELEETKTKNDKMEKAMAGVKVQKG